eukprot:g3666.t1
MSVSIKVGVRSRPCVPFTEQDLPLMKGGEPRLGVAHSVENGEGIVTLHNMDVKKNRYGFSYSWWSAYNWARFFKHSDDIPHCKAIQEHYNPVTSQGNVWDECGKEMKDLLKKGNSVVLFAYGLSGSGKTYSVFGMDAADNPDSWFYQLEGTEKATDQWGIFPRLVFEMYKEKEDGWKFRLKYFQNVVNIVIDLLSPTGEQRQYKDGMRKDKDGFMDITWCQSNAVPTWPELCSTFKKANAKKAIAPTQFNHQSTRGHCILLCEIEMPDPEMEGRKLKGRIYVCDLAGTEPAAEVFAAKYKKIIPDPAHPEKYEMKCMGESDPKKTKELQAQGKAINMSLVEIGMFFKKMATLVKKKQLKPGQSVPGCNSTFLGKYLKDTMMQARTYLFCATRPEMRYKKFTLATLQFAQNASVIKLKPVKATAAASPLERKLMKQIEEMKLAMENMKGGGGASEADLEKLRAQLKAEMENESADEDAAREEKLNAQREEYSVRGMALSIDNEGCEHPYFLAMDREAHKCGNYMIIFEADGEYKIGPDAQIQPFSFNVLPDHCSVKKAGDTVTVVGGVGQTIVNGEAVGNGATKDLSLGDRVVIGGEMYRFEHKKLFEAESKSPMDLMSGEDMIDEFQDALRRGAGSAGGGGASAAEIEAMRKQMEEEREAWLKEHGGAGGGGGGDDALRERAQKDAEDEVKRLNSQYQEWKKILNVLDRNFLEISAFLRPQESMTTGKQDMTKIDVKFVVTNTQVNEKAIIDPYMFTNALSTIKGELTKLKNALKKQEEYSISEENDPVSLLFDTSFHIGTAEVMPEYMIYNLPAEGEDQTKNIRNALPPYDNVGQLKLKWYPCDEEGNEIPEDDLDMIEDPSDFLGKTWRYACELEHAGGLPLRTDEIHCEYEFYGELFKTEIIQNANSNEIDLHWKHVHEVENVQQDFIDWLTSTSLPVMVFVNPYIDPDIQASWTSLSTKTEAIAKNLNCPPVDYKRQVKVLKKLVEQLKGEITELKKQLGGSSVAQKLDDAKATDEKLNG